MVLSLERASRLPKVALMPALVGVAWLSIGAVAAFADLGQAMPPLCPLKRMTGLACATCGGTRSGLALLSGHPVAAFWFNPLVFSVAVVLGGALLVRMVAGRRVRILLTRRQRITAWIVAAGAVAANWIYVIRAGI